MSLFSLKKRAKSTDLATIQDPKVLVCENCGSHILSHFCPECGQKAISYNKPVKEAVTLLLDSWLSFDNRVIHTIGPLFIKPGFLSKEFIEGKRVRNMSPLKIFLFSSVMFFTLSQFSNYEVIISVTDDEPSKKVEVSEKDSLLAAKMIATLDLGEEVAANKKLQDSITRVVAMELSGLDSLGKQSADSLIKHSAKKTKRWKSFKNEAQTDSTSFWYSFQKRVNRFQNNEGEFNQRVSKATSYMFFVLMPMFALLRMLLFRRKRKYYIEHLVLSIHVHAFGFLFLATIFLFEIVTGRNTPYLPLIIFLGFSIYMYKAFRNYYGGRRFSCLSKTMFLWFFYSILFLVVFIISVIVAMLI